jgi:hypothetical protein
MLRPEVKDQINVSVSIDILLGWLHRSRLRSRTEKDRTGIDTRGIEGGR